MDKLLGSLKSKTAWWALALVILGALQQNMDVVTAAIGGGNVGWFVSVTGVITYILRLVTTQPIEAK
jgi:hypothetical protein